MGKITNQAAGKLGRSDCPCGHASLAGSVLRVFRTVTCLTYDIFPRNHRRQIYQIMDLSSFSLCDTEPRGNKCTSNGRHSPCLTITYILKNPVTASKNARVSSRSRSSGGDSTSTWMTSRERSDLRLLSSPISPWYASALASNSQNANDAATNAILQSSTVSTPWKEARLPVTGSLVESEGLASAGIFTVDSFPTFGETNVTTATAPVSKPLDYDTSNVRFDDCLAADPCHIDDFSSGLNEVLSVLLGKNDTMEGMDPEGPAEAGPNGGVLLPFDASNASQSFGDTDSAAVAASEQLFPHALEPSSGDVSDNTDLNNDTASAPQSRAITKIADGNQSENASSSRSQGKIGPPSVSEKLITPNKGPPSRAKACEACRRLKIKCVRSKTSACCDRCSKGGRQCRRVEPKLQLAQTSCYSCLARQLQCDRGIEPGKPMKRNKPHYRTCTCKPTSKVSWKLACKLTLQLTRLQES